MTRRSYFDAQKDFRSGASSPSAFLGACLDTLDAREATLRAFVTLSREPALAAARASDERWRAGAPLSPVDGMPLAIKDVIETADMPTGQGSPYWAGTMTKRDAASVQALRDAGAIILGKTTTTEYATMEPFHRTTNSHDPERTPGGSSSGSAASVGAGIVPVALGTQVVASSIRPASFCGCVGFKPTFGALNRSGSFDHLSQSCTGLIAATTADAWLVASAIATRVGGDPGHPGLDGPVLPPAPARPSRLAFIETGGWSNTSPGARAAIADARRRLEVSGIAIADRASDPDIEAFEVAAVDALQVTFGIFDWEWRWPLLGFARPGADPALLGNTLRARLPEVERMTVEGYRALLARREAVRRRAAFVLGRYDAFVLLAATGAAPKGLGWTGDPAVTVIGSLLGAPCVTLPVLQDEGLPLGLQVMGRMQDDAGLMAAARWIESAWSEAA